MAEKTPIPAAMDPDHRRRAQSGSPKETIKEKTHESVVGVERKATSK